MDVSSKETKSADGCLWAGWGHSPLPTPELDLDREFWVGSVPVSGLRESLPWPQPSSTHLQKVQGHTRRQYGTHYLQTKGQHRHIHARSVCKRDRWLQHHRQWRHPATAQPTRKVARPSCGCVVGCFPLQAPGNASVCSAP